MAKVRVFVSLREDLPEGREVVKTSQITQKYPWVKSVRHVKCYDLEIDTEGPAVRGMAEVIADNFLVNRETETFEVEVLPQKEVLVEA